MAEPRQTLLDVLRDDMDMTGTKVVCDRGACGCCTVHIDGRPVRSCSIPVASVSDRSITTIEGLDSDTGQVVQAAWNELQVPQCGFCQSGQIMSATALLERISNPDDQDINLAMQGNICRCAAYVRIRAAIKLASRNLDNAVAVDE